MDNFFTTPLPDPSPADAPKNWKAFLRELLETLLLAAVMFVVINGATARIRVESVSMQPTLYEKDFVLVYRLAYKFGKTPQRMDVIVFDPPVNTAEPYIKRVIGLPGDTVRIEGGRVYINDAPLEETYLAAPPRYTGEWKVPEGFVFTLGDNRNNSSDSHVWGMAPIANIIGRALVVYWPTNHWKILHQTTALAAGSETNAP